MSPYVVILRIVSAFAVLNLLYSKFCAFLILDLLSDLSGAYLSVVSLEGINFSETLHT